MSVVQRLDPLMSLQGQQRRALLHAGLAGAALAPAAAALAPATAAAVPVGDDTISAGRRLQFPRDHGAHPGAQIEWWYATGWLQAAAAGGASSAVAAVGAAADAGRPLFGFQITFFRSRVGPLSNASGSTARSRFTPQHLLMAHAAITDVAGQTHHHAQRIARWSGDETGPEAHAKRADTAVTLGRWSLRRDADGSHHALLAAPEAGFTLALQLQPSQPVLLQGVAGYSRKGPQPDQASHYTTQPQLQVQAQLSRTGQRLALAGRGWLDHEWSDSLLETGSNGATGWDWIGINLADGGALTAFVLRRAGAPAGGSADGSVVWAGGSHRPPGGATRNFGPDEVLFTPLRHWASPATGARYPVQWRISTPVGAFVLRALLDAQELDSRASVGTVYWEGLAELLDERSARVGLGYLEMTGRAQPLRLGG